MKKTQLLFLSLIFLSCQFLLAQTEIQDTLPAKKVFGDSVSIRWKKNADSVIYLGFHSDKFYLIDSVKLDKKGNGFLRLPINYIDGLCFIGFPSKKGYFDFIYEKNKKIKIEISDDNQPLFPSSSVNQNMINYIKIINKYQVLSKKINDTSLKTSEKEKVQDDLNKLFQEKENFITDYLSKKTNDYLEFLFRTQKKLDLSKFNPTTYQDTLDIINYQVAHYWDFIDFTDERIIYNPLITEKLDEYFDKIIFLNIDTHKVKAIEIINKSLSNKKTYQ